MPGHTVIVGGGIAGLSAAWDLGQAGAPYTLIEKLPRLGGVIETRHIEGCVLEGGPDSFISQKPEALALIQEAGLGDEVIGSNDHQRVTYILRRGKLVPFPEGMMMMVPTRVAPMLATSLVGWGTKIRMGLELFRRPALFPDRSVADFVVDHFGRETLDYIAEPLLSGVYGGDPRVMSVASVLPRFVEMEAKYGSLARAALKPAKSPAGPGSMFRTLRGGLGTLIERLGADANVSPGEARTVEKTRIGFRVRVNGDWIHADNVVLACPAWAAGELSGSLDARLAELLKEIPYSSSLTLSLIYREAEFDGMRAGFGFLIPARERRRLGACTFVGTKFPYRTPPGTIVLRCFFGGAGDEAVLHEPDDALVAMAREELERILGLTAAPVSTNIARWPRSMAQYVVGHAARLKEIESRTAAIPRLYLAGNAYTGIGIPDCIRMGRQAARNILERES